MNAAVMTMASASHRRRSPGAAPAAPGPVGVSDGAPDEVSREWSEAASAVSAGEAGGGVSGVVSVEFVEFMV
ncbi:hypothetical protein Saso_32430 [Streptomyces asoensis]|uniref:Uncharacterized protein n=1 Tax=Streptomyces asoensis TaxID=249586 RepID=A0ABQ3S0C8_9ACTN|nr:hypothetical protein GCM10010496_25760 [Streptomyces asoensis]GHI61593.1 hypothetical protein Saso_32430 [Streptomyces asoensis]